MLSVAAGGRTHAACHQAVIVRSKGHWPERRLCRALRPHNFRNGTCATPRARFASANLQSQAIAVTTYGREASHGKGRHHDDPDHHGRDRYRRLDIPVGGASPSPQVREVVRGQIDTEVAVHDLWIPRMRRIRRAKVNLHDVLRLELLGDDACPAEEPLGPFVS